MPDWKSYLNSDPTNWLLEKDNPSVRYFTLLDILERPNNNPEVKEAKNQIMENGIVPKILAKQNEGGYWEKPENFYRSKYKSTVWQLIILAELGANGKDARIKKACEFILKNSQDTKTGGFSYDAGKSISGGLPSKVIPCLTGNMVWSLIRFGMLNDPRVRKGIKWITKYQRFDDGIKSTRKGWEYERLNRCFSKHSCHMGVVKAIKALAEIPSEKRSKDVKSTIEQGAEYFLIHHVHKKSHKLSKVSKPGWLRLGFPWMYQTDVLELLRILIKLGYKDERMQEAMEVVLSKQDSHGKWNLESTFNGRFQTNIEQKDKPSKWVTLHALRVIKRYYS